MLLLLKTPCEIIINNKCKAIHKLNCLYQLYVNTVAAVFRKLSFRVETCLKHVIIIFSFSMKQNYTYFTENTRTNIIFTDVAVLRLHKNVLFFFFFVT